MEYIKSFCSLDSELFLLSTSSIRIRARIRDMQIQRKLIKKLRRLEEEPDQYSVAVDDILDNLDDFDDLESLEEEPINRAEMIKQEIKVLELEKDKLKVRFQKIS